MATPGSSNDVNRAASVTQASLCGRSARRARAARSFSSVGAGSCDTAVVLPARSADGRTLLFAKNSDRDPNEAHVVEAVPRASDGSTHAVVLCRPFWMSGAEMGVNERGVCIGNESVWYAARATERSTGVPDVHAGGRRAGPLGMDHLRTALERADSARLAVELLGALFAEHGAPVDHGYEHPIWYHNAMLVADPTEAWIFQTAGRDWAARRVAGDFCTISNAPNVELAEPDLCSSHDAWAPLARDSGDLIFTRFCRGRERRRATTRFLEARQRIGPADLFEMLRLHDPHDASAYDPGKGVHGFSVCCHYGGDPIRISQTTGSAVFCVRDGAVSVWVTATAAPCLSIFLPLWLDAFPPQDALGVPCATFDPAALWWRHERLHRAAVHGFRARAPLFLPEMRALEARFIAGAGALEARAVSASERRAFSVQCIREAAEAYDRWADVCAAAPAGAGLLHAFFWSRRNRACGIPAATNAVRLPSVFRAAGGALLLAALPIFAVCVWRAVAKRCA